MSSVNATAESVDYAWQTRTVSTLYRNGRIHTPQGRAATALLVDGSTIRWIGDEDGATAYSEAAAIDLDGALVTPGMVDAHVHATATGLALTGLDLRGATSLGQALDLLERASRKSRGRPVLGGGWNDADWPEGRGPTAAELDRASYGGVVYLTRVDMHSAVVSSALMAAVPGLAGMGGYRPDGWMREPDAHDAVREAAHAALTRGQREDAQRTALRAMAGEGIVSAHEMAGPVISDEQDLSDLLTLSAAEDLPEVIGYWGELLGVEKARALGATGVGGDLFCDGSLGSGTAALREPYADRPGVGWLRFDTEDLVRHIRAGVAAGLQVGFHAIGDAAVDQVLEAFERASVRPGWSAGAGHRIEHAEYVQQPSRLAASGLAASMQPAFDALWGGRHGMYADRLGPDRAPALNRFGDLAAAGVPLAFGSDSPVTALGPWAAIRAAAYPNDPAAALSIDDALHAHTVGGWRAAGRPGEGELRVGAPATFAIWDTSQVTGSGLPDLSPGMDLPVCRRTVLRGRTIYLAD
ncbi:MAG: amidohydrolase [Jatrophihabitans sp.]